MAAQPFARALTGMCFSATASFGAAAVLLATGAAAWRHAVTDGDRPVAAIPILFGVQQFVEGLVWQGVGQGDEQMTRMLAYLYSIFSHLLWPVYVPWVAWISEPTGPRRRILGQAFAASWVLEGYLLLSLWSDPITVQACSGHLVYDGARQGAFGPGLMLAYVAATCGTLMMSTRTVLRRFGLAVLLSLGLTLAAYAQWMVSVWCFFAAVLSFFLLAHLVRPVARSTQPA